MLSTFASFSALAEAPTYICGRKSTRLLFGLEPFRASSFPL